MITPFLHHYCAVLSAHALVRFLLFLYRQLKIPSEPTLIAHFCFPSLTLLAFVPSKLPPNLKDRLSSGLKMFPKNKMKRTLPGLLDQL